jgi:MYXO-CTERM domain-containing protein
VASTTRTPTAFLDECLSIVGGAICGGQHAAQCGSSESQSSHRELLALFGPSAPDEQAPSVAITAPADGSSFPEGASFAIVVVADDGGSDESSSGESGIGDGWPSGEPIDDSRPQSCACDGGHARTPFGLAALVLVTARSRRRK